MDLIEDVCDLDLLELWEGEDEVQIAKTVLESDGFDVEPHICAHHLSYDLRPH